MYRGITLAAAPLRTAMIIALVGIRLCSHMPSRAKFRRRNLFA